MGKILFLTHIYPFPPDDGGRIVTYNTLRVIEKRGHTLFFVSFIEEQKEINDEIGDMKQYLINKKYSNSALKLFLNLFQKVPYTMKKYQDSKIEFFIREILQDEEIDKVILDHLHMASYVKLIKKLKPDLPVFLRQHNIESQIMKRAYQKEENILKKLYLFIQYKKLYKFESEICGKMDCVFVITDEDKQMLMNMNSSVGRIEVVKAGVDFQKYKPMISAEKTDNKNLVFLGAMNWLPNENGVVWFVENVFPEVLKEEPNIRLIIVGKSPTEKVKMLANKYPNHLTITGYVEDERDYISMADVFIVPLLIGGGMRIKILNALAMKKAVVSTSVGAEGINLKDSYLEANTPEEFADAIKKLLIDDSVRFQIEENGYKNIVKYYSFDTVLEPLLDHLNE